MINESVTQAVGKRIVGKQNLLPLLRDAVEDEREMVVSFDTERQRYRGNPVANNVSSGSEYVIIVGDFPGKRDRVSVKTSRLLSIQIESVLGCTTPTDIYAQMHLASKESDEHN